MGGKKIKKNKNKNKDEERDTEPSLCDTDAPPLPSDDNRPSSVLTEDEAATKIQAVYRGHAVRTSMVCGSKPKKSRTRSKGCCVIS